MAQLAENPMSIAVGDVPITVRTGMTYIKQIEFVGYSVASDAIALTNINGKDLWQATGATDFSVVRSGDIGWVNGVIVASITPGSTGIVKIYFK